MVGTVSQTIPSVQESNASVVQSVKDLGFGSLNPRFESQRWSAIFHYVLFRTLILQTIGSWRYSNLCSLKALSRGVVPCPYRCGLHSHFLIVAVLRLG
jgi:hypothetical protein